ncbi:CRM-domain containing factor CFM9, mitochondrial [Mercurialis annua]|uniref:CRM-domain containing factor CFM9, mitochondrial n=1 Tax=Mercurialis annua TaxID=3986 RepID=UPI00215EA5A6|nr:CRM-domain containing factor CFM9, mitochondrial [Mercurialis annua]
MFAVRKLYSHNFKTLSSQLLSNPNRNALLVKNVSPKLTRTQLMQPSISDEDRFCSYLPLNHSFYNGTRRWMSTPRGRSMRSKVEQRMQKESSKTVREIRRAKKLKKKLMTDEERMIYNLKRAKKKVALLLQKLKKYELPDLPPPLHDPELFTPEQIQAYKKIGFRNKNYVPVGVRGVFGGVVQNMHLHWKFHETVQVCCDNFPKEKIKEMATMLARLSGGIVINTHNVKTIIMFRGRNYRQPKNLIPINTLTKRKALFKARFEQALESQKLNIKKIEQQLRRMGVNPEDPVAMASIQRVASTFFNAIDKKEGSPYVFQGDIQPVAQPTDDLNLPDPGESDQEELDKFIAEIEDAADKEWAEEEAKEQEEFGKIRYWNKEEYGGRVRRSEMYRNEISDGEERGARRWKDAHDTRRNSDRDNDSDMSDGGDQWDSGDVGNVHKFESDADDSSDEVHSAQSRYRGVQRQRDGIGRDIGRDYNDKNISRRNPVIKFQREVVEEKSESEEMLSDLDNAMWESSSEEEGEARAPRVEASHKLEDISGDQDSQKLESNSRQQYDLNASRKKSSHDFRSSRNEKMGFNAIRSDAEENDKLPHEFNISRHAEQERTRSSFRTSEDNIRQRITQEDSGSENMISDSEVAEWESETDVEEDSRAGNEWKHDYGDSGETEDYQHKQCETNEVNYKKKTQKEVDEDWDSD